MKLELLSKQAPRESVPLLNCENKLMYSACLQYTTFLWTTIMWVIKRVGESWQRHEPVQSWCRHVKKWSMYWSPILCTCNWVRGDSKRRPCGCYILCMNIKTPLCCTRSDGNIHIIEAGFLDLLVSCSWKKSLHILSLALGFRIRSASSLPMAIFPMGSRS